MTYGQLKKQLKSAWRDCHAIEEEIKKSDLPSDKKQKLILAWIILYRDLTDIQSKVWGTGISLERLLAVLEEKP